MLILFSTQVYSQTDLGIGLVSIDFDDKTVLEFYSDTIECKPVKVIEFFDDRAINSWNIKELDKQKKWLKPEVLYFQVLLKKSEQNQMKVPKKLNIMEQTVL